MDVEAPESTSTANREPTGEPERRRRRKRRRPGARRRLFMRVVRRSSLSIFLLVGAILVVAAQTDEGQELVLQAALDRVRGALAGELVVGGIRSGTLITGATLTNVRLDAAEGRRFLRADSVVVRYSLLSLLTGGTPIRSTTLWGVDVEISRPTEGDVLNVTRLISSGTKDSAGVNVARPVQLGRIGIRNGTVRLLTPASPGTALNTVLGPDGRPLQQIRFDDLDLDLERAVVRPGAAVSFEAGLASLSGSVQILDEPIRIHEVFGYATFGSQQGIRVEGGAFRLPSTLLRGDLLVGPSAPGEPWTLTASLTVDGWGELEDLAWVDARMPDGSFRGSVTVRIPDEVVVDLEGFEAQLPASHVLASGQMRFGDVMSLRSMEVTARPIVLDRLEPWVDTELPLDGWLSGRATFSGTLTDLSATGRVTLVPTGLGDGSPTTGDFSGVWHRGADPGATGMTVRLDDLNYSVIRALIPGLEFTGSGGGSIELEGRASSGLNVIADFTHEPSTGTAVESRFRARGRVWRPEGGVWNADLSGDVAPLSMALFAGMAPELGLHGTVSGPVSASGPLDSLEVSGEMRTEGGRVAFEAAADVTSPGSAYRVTAEGDAFPVSAISSEVPQSTTWSGHLELEGRGLTLDSLEARATLLASASRIGPVTIDSARADVRISRGVLITDTVSANLSGVRVAGRGRFGLAQGAWGSSNLSFSSDRLTGLRPLLMGVPDDQLVIDELDELERAFQVASGVDVDTLPTAEDIRLDGGVRGSATLSGEIRAFDLGLLVDVVDGAYKGTEVDSARVAITASGLPGTGGDWGLGVSAQGIEVEGRRFQQGGLDAEMSAREGTGRIQLVRNASEEYRAAGSFRVDSIGGQVGFETGQIRVGQDIWNFARPANVAWDDRSLSIDSLRVEREGDDPMTLTAHGTLTRGGRSDFRVDVDGLHLDRIVHIGQFTGLQLGGHLDLDLSVTGPAESPMIDGSFHVDGPEYGAVRLTRLEGALEYADRRAAFDVRGWDEARDAVHASGELPLDLSLALVDDRTLDLPMSMTIEADSLDAAIALSYLTSLEQVTGSLTGEVTVGGTLESPSPEGRVSLSDAAWTIEAIGVRHSGVAGELTLNRDRTVDVSLSAGGRAAGGSTVTGTVRLEPFTNPPLDLTFEFDRFQAVDRLDVESRISGQFTLGGTYRRPVASGALTLEESTVYVDEFRRAASVVDLTDPTLLDLGVGVDTTALVTQPLLAGLRNPFFDNLRVNIDLEVPRDTWLRSTETNVEMAGDLLVVYDRSEGDLVLVGELEALRGSHLVLNRSFELEGGTVSFIGRPGLNPDLDIEATTRIRRRDNPDLEVVAHVGGTLIQPAVTLSTDEVGIAEADLMSYLVFGQPSRELGSSQSALFRDTDVSSAVTRNLEGGLQWYSGILANQVGAAIAQGTPLVDYLSVQGGLNGLLGTQLEAGSYVGRDFFVVAVFQWGGGQSDAQNTVRGVRVEWDGDALGAEVFWEDRFLRSSSGGIPLPDLTLQPRVFGLFVFRDWGY